MEAIETLSQFSPISVIQIISSVIILIVGAGIGIKKAYGVLETWRQKKNGYERKNQTVEERLTKLEDENAQEQEKLDKIDATLQEILANLELITEENRKDTIITNRSLIYRLHAEFVEKGYLTFAESEMFEEISQRYLDAGGNSLFKSHIIPAVQALPVHD